LTDEPTPKTEQANVELNSNEQKLLNTYRVLNTLGQRKLFERIEELFEVDKYVMARTVSEVLTRQNSVEASRELSFIPEVEFDNAMKNMHKTH
jgi:hypothetical protein